METSSSIKLTTIYYFHRKTLIFVILMMHPKFRSIPASIDTVQWRESQNATDPSSKRGQEIIRHAALGIDIHLFVRENKLAAGKAASFTYHGRVVYQSHQGSQPMSVVFGLQSGAG
jgi:hypothetical protein